MTATDAWADAVLAAALLAVDPGLGGAVLHARPGPARDAWLDRLARLAPDRPALRLPVGISDERLSGGLDLAATLAAGRPVQAPGLLAEARGRVLVLPMAERAGAGLAARLGAALDSGAAFTLIALDEGEAEEDAPRALADRLAFAPRLSDLPLAALVAGGPGAEAVAAARGRLPAVAVEGAAGEALVRLAATLGIDSLRAPLLALRAARAAAALAGLDRIGEAELAAAARLVLAPRARRLPEAAEADEPDPPSEESEQQGDEERGSGGGVPEEMLVEAARAAIPADLLARLAAGLAPRRAKGAGAGGEAKSSLRGRPVGSGRGSPRTGARLDLIETLRAAAPWQPLRRREAGARSEGVLVRPSDFRVKRYKRRAERVAIFVVDASGSTALARLAEAKGAVELLLGQAYVARQQVALVAFRGPGAEVLLPPTRSLVATKRRLASLPGGGGTPLAAGLVAGLGLAAQARMRGLVPEIAVLTDGRANIALDGRPGRAEATADAERVARSARATGQRALVIDTGQRPSEPARALAAAMGAGYLPLPRADARALSGAVAAFGAA